MPGVQVPHSDSDQGTSVQRTNLGQQSCCDLGIVMKSEVKAIDQALSRGFEVELNNVRGRVRWGHACQGISCFRLPQAVCSSKTALYAPDRQVCAQDHDARASRNRAVTWAQPQNRRRLELKLKGSVDHRHPVGCQAHQHHPRCMRRGPTLHGIDRVK